jgi:hypothetical protein
MTKLPPRTNEYWLCLAEFTKLVYIINHSYNQAHPYPSITYRQRFKDIENRHMSNDVWYLAQLNALVYLNNSGY